MIIQLREKPQLHPLYEKLTLYLMFNHEYREQAEVFNQMEPGKFYKVEVKEVKASKTLSQNAYAWRMIGDIAKYERLSKEEVYKTYVRDFRQYDIVAVRKDAAEKFTKNWKKNGLGWQVDTIHADDENVELMIYYGMTAWDKSVMTDFIEFLRHECQERMIPCDRLI